MAWVGLDADRSATAFSVSVFSLLVAARITDVWSSGWSAEVPVTLALFIIPVLYAFPATRQVLDRHRLAVIAVQGMATWVSFAVFGRNWQVGIGGLLAGLILLTVRGRLGWVIAGLLLTAEVAVRASVTGMPLKPSWVGAVVVITYYVNDAMIVFGVVRISQIVADLKTARVQALQLAVARQRLRTAESLEAAVGNHLADIASQTSGAQESLYGDPAETRTRVAAAGAAARDAAEQARSISMSSPREPSAPVLPHGRAVIGARVAWAVVVTVLLMFLAEGGSLVLILPTGAVRKTVILAAIALTGALQTYHSYAVSKDRRPRAWPVTLALQALLAYSFLFHFIWTYNGGLAPFLAGSVLLLLPDWWRWIGYLAVVVSYSVLAVTLPLVGNNVINGVGPHLPTVLNYAAETAVIGLLIFGLSRLTALARQFETLQGHVAQTAAVQERLRVARDVHDLLGLGLTAIALKADLVGKLIGRDNTVAATQIKELSRICAATTAELRLITENEARLHLWDELDAAEQILTSGGVQVRVVATERAVPTEADEVLAPVLREAVTNVLRHSVATVCLIEVTANDRAQKLRVSNDGIEERSAREERAGVGGGRGLANLAARIRSVGGRLECHESDGRFVLAAEVPLRKRPASADRPHRASRNVPTGRS
jgi:two-component system, NarL family, sensor histidine kinase DesK